MFELAKPRLFDPPAGTVICEHGCPPIYDLRHVLMKDCSRAQSPTDRPT